jgi:hypothetical protein
MNRVRPDLAMCADDGCPSRGECRHHEAGGRKPHPTAQNYADFQRRPHERQCDHFSPNYAPAHPGRAEYLRHEGVNDYRLVGESCWIAVGEHVVYIRKQGRGVIAEIYDDKINRINGLIAEAEAKAEAE